MLGHQGVEVLEKIRRCGLVGVRGGALRFQKSKPGHVFVFLLPVNLGVEL